MSSVTLESVALSWWQSEHMKIFEIRAVFLLIMVHVKGQWIILLEACYAKSNHSSQKKEMFFASPAT